MVEDIMTAISLVLHKQYQVPVYGDEAVVQGMDRPCFFISIPEVVSTLLPSGRRRIQVPVDVAYFPQKVGHYENMHMVGEELMELLETIKLGDGSLLRGRNPRYAFSDGLLHFFESFVLHIVQHDSEDIWGELMEDISIDLDV